MPPAISVIASIQVSEAIKIILGEKPSLAGKLLFFDMDDLSIEKINLAQAESCRVCGIGSDRAKCERPRRGDMREKRKTGIHIHPGDTR